METTKNIPNYSENISENGCCRQTVATNNKTIFSFIFTKKIILFLSAFFLMLFFVPQNTIAQNIGDELELDGNAVDDNASDEKQDWADISGASVSTGIVSDLNNIFTTGGSKDDLDIPNWRWSAAELIPDKDDILHAGFALYGDDKLYFFADRLATNGDAALGFWLFKSQVSINFDGTFNGIHTIGDILIVSHFSNGGGVSTIVALKWVGTGGDATANGTLQYVSLASAGAYAITNSDDIAAPWPYTPKSGTSGVIPKGAFMEGGIDLGVLSPQGIDPCFASFLVETRSSTSVDAQLKDFVNGAFNTKPLVSVNSGARCVNGAAVVLTASVNGGVAPLSYLWSNGATTSSISVSPDQTTVYTVTVTGHNGCVANPASGTVSVNPSPACQINDAVNSGGIPEITCGSPGGSPGNTISTSNVDAGNTYFWEFVNAPSGWAINGSATGSQISFTSGDCPISFVTIQLTITNAAGCVSICTKNITPNPKQSSCDAQAGADKLINCFNRSVTLEGSTATPSQTADNGDVYQSLYSWAGPGIVSGGNTLSPVVNAPGDYTLTVHVFPGVGGDLEKSCTDVVHVNQDITPPSCAISGVDPTCTSLNNVYSGPDAPQGKSYSYAWSISGATNASISGAVDGKSVTVISGSCNAHYTLHLTVTDLGNGCVSECSREFGYIDDVAPIIGQPGANATLDCPAVPQFAAPTATDACSTATVEQVGQDVRVGGDCDYTVTRTWRAVDACGNISGNVSQTIRVHDVTLPTIDDAVASSTLECPAQPQFTQPAGHDECSSVTIHSSDQRIGSDCNYTITRTYYAEDACGNKSREVSQSITVRDITAPIIGQPGANATIDCPAVPAFVAPSATDECSSARVEQVGQDVRVGGDCDYTVTRTWRAVDVCGNASGNVSQTIRVHDDTAPTIDDAVASSTLECPAQPQFTQPAGHDECSSVTIHSSDLRVGGDCNYTITRTYYAEDLCGNRSREVSQSITVRDITAPIIGQPGANATIDCPAVPAFSAPSATDECSSARVEQVGQDVRVGGDCDYTVTRTWRAVDVCGNASGNVSQTIRVHDDTAPTIDDAVASSTLECPAQPQFTQPGARDECSSVTIHSSDQRIGSDCNYTITRTYYAEDLCGNKSREVSQSITVRDVTPPSIFGEGADEFLSSCTDVPVFTPPTATDLCDQNPIVNVVSTNSIVNVDGSITHTRIWNASDQCDNVSAEVDQVITVAPCLNEYCSLTQGFYGNAKGIACATGERGSRLIYRLLGSPYGDLVIGKPGRSLTIDQAHAVCITMRLPAGGTATVLPIGDQSFGDDCYTSIPLNQRGGFKNVLLGQTITLGLNLRMNSNLGGLIISGTSFTTVGSNPGADGICGTSDDVPDFSSVITKSIPQEVLTALADIYGSASIANLFDLANRALGGQSLGGASINQINQAVSSINEGFDGCRFLQGFSSNGDNLVNKQITSENIENSIEPLEFKAIPNPFTSSTVLELTSKDNSNLKVEIYNITGMRVAILYNDQVNANELNSMVFDGHLLPNGMYICSITTNDKVYFYKLLLTR